jgi:transposase
MLAILLGWFRLIWLFGRGHHAVVLENLALRQQLVIYKRTKKRPRLVGRDRWFWIALSVVWKDWRKPLFVVHPDTVIRWQRERFRRYWAQRSKKSGRPGRPPISSQVRELIRTMACANPLWRAPRIHGELRKLGIEVSERTVSRVLRTVKRPPSQTPPAPFNRRFACRSHHSHGAWARFPTVSVLKKDRRSLRPQEPGHFFLVGTPKTESSGLSAIARGSRRLNHVSNGFPEEITLR